MIVFSPLLKKESFLFTDEQKDIVVTLINDYFRLEIPEGNGSYLATFDYSKIDFYFCKSFFYNVGNAVLGAWTPLFFNSVFVVPTFWNKAMVQDFKQSQIYKKYNLNQYDKNSNFYRIVLPENATDDQLVIIGLWNSYNNDLVFYNKEQKSISNRFSLFVLNIDLYYFLYNFLHNQIIITLMHQLYHKYQFSAAWYMPIIYAANHLLSQFFGYNLASNMSWTIQGNVRTIVDNQNTSCLIEKFINIYNRLPEMYNFLQLGSKQNFVKDYTDNDPAYIKRAEETYNDNISLYIKTFDTKQAKLLFRIFRKYNIVKNQFIQKIQQFIKDNK